MSARAEGVTTTGRETAASRGPAPPKRTAVIAGGRRKVHTTYPNGSEMVEEYDLRSNDLLVRKRRGRSMLGAVQDWVYTCGQPPSSSSSSSPSPSSSSSSNAMIRESSTSPILVRKDTVSSIEFRIRNLFYPVSVYDVSIDDTRQDIVVRTSNKKYFKRIIIPEITELGIRLDARNLTWQYGNNTLLMVYRKPAALIEKEQRDREEILNEASVNTQEGQNPTGPGECRQQ